jgi:tRNA modification GTPase
MSYDPHDTICAIASADGGAARGIVRVSGARAIEIVDRLFESDGGARLEELRRPTSQTGRVGLNAALTPPYAGGEVALPCDAFAWPTSRSYTREPVVELHTIGSRPLVDLLLSAICQAGARVAERGEFTLRAFLAGRIDLTQAEAVLGVIDAHGEAEFDAALAQLAGGLARPMQSLRDNLLQLLAELEAGLDFVDEGISFVSHDEVRTRLAEAENLLGAVAEQMASRTVVGPTAQVVLVGRANAGKSSLFNALVQRFGIPGNAEGASPRPAIVSPRHGTTRDYLTARIEIDDVPIELVDTAGVDAVSSTAPPSSIEETAQTLAANRRAEATLRLQCVEIGENLVDDLSLLELNDFVVVTKCDLATNLREQDHIGRQSEAVIITSSRTGEGLDQLAAAIRRAICSESSARRPVVAATAERCRESVCRAQAALERAVEIAATSDAHELLAAEIRIALDELGKVVGVVYTDDLLDRIFSTFCIGK